MFCNLELHIWFDVLSKKVRKRIKKKEKKKGKTQQYWACRGESRGKVSDCISTHIIASVQTWTIPINPGKFSVEIATSHIFFQVTGPFTYASLQINGPPNFGKTAKLRIVCVAGVLFNKSFTSLRILCWYVLTRKFPQKQQFWLRVSEQCCVIAKNFIVIRHQFPSIHHSIYFACSISLSRTAAFAEQACFKYFSFFCW